MTEIRNNNCWKMRRNSLRASSRARFFWRGGGGGGGEGETRELARSLETKFVGPVPIVYCVMYNWLKGERGLDTFRESLLSERTVKVGTLTLVYLNDHFNKRKKKHLFYSYLKTLKKLHLFACVIHFSLLGFERIFSYSDTKFQPTMLWMRNNSRDLRGCSI